MSVLEKDPVSEVLDRVNAWPPAAMDSARAEVPEIPAIAARLGAHPHSIAQRPGGIAQDRRPPLTDEECRNILEEELMKKYGK